MSGGEFGFAYASIADEMGGRWEDSEMNALFDDLFCGGEFSVRGYGGLAQSLDFWLSGDTTEEDYREDLARFKQKWFRRTPKNRVEFYQKKLQEDCDRYKKELGDV